MLPLMRYLRSATVASKSLLYALLALLLLLTMLVARQTPHYSTAWPLFSALATTNRVTLVAASHSTANTTWLLSSFLSWQKKIYLTDTPSSTVTVPANKGHEGMVYLTYIIDNYPNFSSVTIFYHADRYQWHNGMPAISWQNTEDGLEMLSRLNLSYVEEQGFVNLRCIWEPGCPFSSHPLEDEADSAADRTAHQKVEPKDFYKKSFEGLFPGVPLPLEVGASCCAQFAVTAATIQKRSKAEYQHYRQWLLYTDMTDVVSGTNMEYMWHIMFGKPAVHCPDNQECYCNLYGLCDLRCTANNQCYPTRELH